MRRIIAFIALVFVLAGCSKAFEPKPKDVAAVYKNDFSVKAKAAYGENETDFKITKNGMSISFIVESPKELSGLSIALSDEHAKVDFEGMELLLGTENLPEKAPFFYFFPRFHKIRSLTNSKRHTFFAVFPVFHINRPGQNHPECGHIYFPPRGTSGHRKTLRRAKILPSDQTGSLWEFRQRALHKRAV